MFLVSENVVECLSGASFVVEWQRVRNYAVNTATTATNFERSLTFLRPILPIVICLHQSLVLFGADVIHYEALDRAFSF